MRDKILIYCDYGSNDIRVLEKSLKEYFEPLDIKISRTDANSIIKENSLDETVLAFFMPGGQATPYLEKLKIQGNTKIADYVRNGGVYFGICAGAYYASKKVYFEKDIKELAIIQQCGLDILSAETIGTLYKELKISPYTRDFNSMSAIKVRWINDNEHHTVCYHGGPYFQFNPDSNIEILAEYELKDKKLPAAVIQNYGKGKVIASGLHIEDSAKDLRQLLFFLREDKEKAFSIIKELEQGETSRRKLFEKFMQKII